MGPRQPCREGARVIKKPVLLSSLSPVSYQHPPLAKPNQKPDNQERTLIPRLLASWGTGQCAESGGWSWRNKSNRKKCSPAAFKRPLPSLSSCGPVDHPYQTNSSSYIPSPLPLYIYYSLCLGTFHSCLAKSCSWFRTIEIIMVWQCSEYFSSNVLLWVANHSPRYEVGNDQNLANLFSYSTNIYWVLTVCHIYYSRSY